MIVFVINCGSSSLKYQLIDTDTDTLFCMRDQFGTVPFYYYETADGNFLVGTSIRDVMAQPGFEKVFNQRLLQIYLSLTYTTGPETFFKGLMKLLPGRYLVRKDGKNEITRYFRATFQPDDSKTLEQWADEIEATLKIILAETKEPEEYAESFLSSGVDSSYIFAQSVTVEEAIEEAEFVLEMTKDMEFYIY